MKFLSIKGGNIIVTPLTSILSLWGRGSKKSLLPLREKVRMRGI